MTTTYTEMSKRCETTEGLIDAVLQDPDSYRLQMLEPVSCLRENGESYVSGVRLIYGIQPAIDQRRAFLREKRPDLKVDDRGLLIDVIVVGWATILKVSHEHHTT
jgi:hypothetical protein